MKYYVIVDPTSGRGLGERSIPQIESGLRENGLDSTLTLELLPLELEIICA